MSVHVTEHAIDRYLERVAPVGREQARSIIQSAEPAFEFATRFGSHVVHLQRGGKAVLRRRDQIHVVTVIGNGQIDREMFQALDRPACCGLCGVQSSHPIADVCTRTECPLGAQRGPAAGGERR